MDRFDETEENIYATNEVVLISGLSLARCIQYAKRYNLKKFGRSYIWTTSDLKDLIDRKREQ